MATKFLSPQVTTVLHSSTNIFILIVATKQQQKHQYQVSSPYQHYGTDKGKASIRPSPCLLIYFITIKVFRKLLEGNWSILEAHVKSVLFTCHVFFIGLIFTDTINKIDYYRVNTYISP